MLSFHFSCAFPALLDLVARLTWCVSRALVYRDMKNFKSSVEDYSLAIDLEEDYPDNYFARGIYLLWLALAPYYPRVLADSTPLFPLFALLSLPRLLSHLLACLLILLMIQAKLIISTTSTTKQ